MFRHFQPMPRVFKPGVTILILMLIPALAQAADMERKGMRVCKPDVDKFCHDVKPGEGRILQCLQKNSESLSGDCKQRISDMKSKMEAAREACKADVEELCNDVKPGDGRIMQCLKKHEEHLSQKCRNTFQKGMEGRSSGDAGGSEDSDSENETKGESK